MDPKLLITNIGFIVAFIVSFSLSIFVLMKGPKQQKNIAFFWVNFLVAIFDLSHLIGINLKDPEMSRLAFMATASTKFIGVFGIQLLFAVTDQVYKRKKILTVLFSVGIGLFIYYMLFPDHFLLPSVSLFYFPNYYNRGDLYFVSDVYFLGCIGYFFYSFIGLYRKADYVLRNRLKFFLIASIYGYAVGLTPLLPLYGIPFDPFMSAFFWFYGVIFAYAIFKYDLIDLHLVAKKALMYTLGVMGVSLFIIAINTLGETIAKQLPNVSILFVPVISAIITIAVGRFVWVKVREADILKYEFINIATHKFRTPLTYIKWSVNNLRSAQNEEDRRIALNQIENANARLVELTNLLTETAEAEKSNHIYKLEPMKLQDIAETIIGSFKTEIATKKLNMSVNLESDTPEILGDAKRMAFVIQVLFENALNYTPIGGSLRVDLTHAKNQILFSVKDSGIGIATNELPFIFDKFFRTKRATTTDTEGMGVGLFITKRIVEKHGGKIWAESEGAGKGSTFYLAFKKR